MDNLLAIAFELHHPCKKHHRHYEIVLGRELLDDWAIVIRYGRVRCLILVDG